MDLSENYESTLKFLLGFRQWTETRQGRFYIDLRPLQRITPAAALLLVAEFDRWNVTHRHKLRAYDVDQWHPSVRTLLSQMGFFKLLEVRTLGKVDDGPRNIVFLPFSKGRDANGRPVQELRVVIEAVAGLMKKPLKLAFFQAVSEAITNVRQHAYRSAPGKRSAQFYWMSASVDFETRMLTVMVVDHGIGIPRSLPLGALDKFEGKKDFLGRLIRFLGVRSLAGFNDDAKLIQAAVVLGESRTGDRFRGHGFTRDIQWLVRQNSGPATLRVHSNNGTYKFSKDESGEMKVELTNRKTSLGGTFIEWRLQLDAIQLRLAP